MIDFFEYLYNLPNDKSLLLKKMRIYSLFRFVVRVVSNFLLPLYFIATGWVKKYRIDSVDNNYNINKVVVSLTSFPARINHVWLVIESILRQSVKPDILILWLSNEQFQSKDILPKRLRNLEDRGLTIILCDDDLRSHKKYYYSVKKYPNNIIITVDDDVFYGSNTLKPLLDLNKKYPNSICCNNAVSVKNIGGVLTPYINWPDIKAETQPNYFVLPIGVGAILYPPNCFHQDIFNIELMKRLCFYADDIWLNAMARLKGTMSAKSNNNSLKLPIFTSGINSLTNLNVENGLNDVQIIRLRKYYIDNYGVDLYKTIEIESYE